MYPNQYAWKLYNFEDDLNEKELYCSCKAFNLKIKINRKKNCGRFECFFFLRKHDDETETLIQVDRVLTKNSDCALTFDNTLKILQQDLQQHLKSAEEWHGRIHLIFLNEINTSPDVGAFKEVFCDHNLK
ncbi:hypothetical protein RFI_04026 [Reticulomyxa filosa]|uniref:Uncharacterized protein n=1 Tax=Reticulomyxa filosa TaxID=46433 RepID=X6P4D3_RETFI|nr:hypothetical protein RFI_04026 [Reticulomyxa filosa]|eukprot:ETO33081.1 hypothetical protein RFI_04026 [Reticulomyxa filosa]